MSMRAALVEAREYIANDLAEIIDSSSIDYTRANISENALPYVEKAEGIIAKIDAALSGPRPTPNAPLRSTPGLPISALSRARNFWRTPIWWSACAAG